MSHPSGTTNDERARFPLGRVCIFSFVIMAFVFPGVWGAVIGSSPPTPRQMGGTWATWIASYAGVFLFGYAATKVVLRLLERRKHR